MIEIAIVLLIIVIVAVFVVPQVINYMKMYRLGVAARNVATALQRARYLATSNNTRAGILISEVNRVEIQEYDLTGEKEPQQKGLILMPDGVTISSDLPRHISFDGRGVVTPLPKESPAIRIDSISGYFTVVTVSPTGQVTVSEMKHAGES